jgi:hypothetical protein
MPLYMDHHKNLEGLSAEAVAEDHKRTSKSRTSMGLRLLGTGSTSTRARSTAFLRLRTRRRRRPSIARRMGT